jgi:predicted CXXCH cytochrome family protein
MRRPSWSRRCGYFIAITSVVLTLNTCGGGDGGGITDVIDVPTNMGPDGGTLTFSGGNVTLVFPAGAVSRDIKVTVASATNFPQDPRIVIGAAYLFGPAGTSFAQPVQLTVRYDEGGLSGGVREDELRLFEVVGSVWTEVDGSAANAVANQVSGAITSFSTYGVLGVPVSSVELDTYAKTLQIGWDHEFQATPRDADGNPLPDRPIDWSTSNSATVALVPELPGVVVGLRGGLATISATSEEVSADADVTVEGDPFGLYGYLDTAEKVTPCAGCHSSQQLSWVSTLHAIAWEGLQASGSARPVCEGCHSVSERGNTIDEPAGFNVEPGEQFTDVQCESCHGPGPEHWLSLPGPPPLAPISVGPELSKGCGECHTGTHHPYVDQWSQSRHGTVPAQAGRAGESPECKPCHEGNAALEKKFFESPSYLEADDGANQPIVCAVCHDPHGSFFSADLRADITDHTFENNLCVRCHANRGTPPAKYGPHGAQGPLVLGQNVGWQPAGFEMPALGPHGNEMNERLCATCHVSNFVVEDPNTGGFVFNSVGHLFKALACTDPAGVPTLEPCDVFERDFGACATCHSSEAEALQLYLGLQEELHVYLDSLWLDTDNDHVIDASDRGLFPGVVALGDPFELDVTDDVVTVAEGALWNAQLAHTAERPYFGDGEAFGITFSSHPSGGNGIHNPALLRALLQASIDAMLATYFSQASATVKGRAGP